MEKKNKNTLKEKLHGRKSYVYNILIACLFVVALLIYTKVLAPNTNNAQTISSIDSQIELIIEPDMGKTPILSAIKDAKSSIDLEIYLFSDTDILQELENAKKRGVNVRVILEENPYGGFSSNTETKNKLAYYGIDWKWDNKNYEFTHSKFLIIDSKTGYIMNFNLSNASFTKNREFAIVTTDKTVIEELKNIFEADWNRKPYNPPENSPLVVSPENSRDKLKTLLKRSRGEILIYTEVLDDQEIKDILKQRRAYGAEVKVILADPESIPSNAEAVKELSRYGVDCKYVFTPYIHAKVIIVDETYAFVGSENLTTNSLDENREVGVIISDKGIISQIADKFVSDFGS